MLCHRTGIYINEIHSNTNLSSQAYTPWSWWRERYIISSVEHSAYLIFGMDISSRSYEKIGDFNLIILSCHMQWRPLTLIYKYRWDSEKCLNAISIIISSQAGIHFGWLTYYIDGSMHYTLDQHDWHLPHSLWHGYQPQTLSIVQR